MSEVTDSAAPAVIAACGKCGRESTLVAAFTPVYTFQGPKRLCPHCSQRKRKRGTYKTWAWASAALLLIPAVTAAGWLPSESRMLMAWGGVVLAMYVSVLPHEFGHALMARAVGYAPLAIVWGGFPSVVDRKFFGVRTLIGLAPESGFAWFEPRGDRWMRVKHFAITAAGPLTNLLIALLAFSAASMIDGPFHTSWSKCTLLVFGVANTLLALVNLWPRTVNTAVGNAPSDGARLWAYLRGKPIDAGQQRHASSRIRMFFAFRDEEFAVVLAEAEAFEASHGPAPWLAVARSAALCSLDRPAEARELLLRALQGPEMHADPQFCAFARNNLACANFALDEPDLDAESLELSAQAMQVLPWVASVVITRCCALSSRAAAGSARLDEARLLLSRVHELELSNTTRMGMAIAQGLIAAAEGEFVQARLQLDAARRIGEPGLAGRLLEARLPSR